MRWMTWMSALVATSVTFGWNPGEAKACGGTFCDAPPDMVDVTETMPVDQTGENIIFVLGENTVEAHIQIQYDPETEAERFAWIVPVMAEPEIGVSSEQLFLNTLNGTVPGYALQVTRQSCGGGGGGGGGGDDWDDGCSSAGNASGDTAGDGGTGGSDVDTTGGGTEVVSEASVGAFDYVVLQSTSAQELMTWLGDNEFEQDPEAEPILQEYIDEGALFVAFRLTQGAQTSEIHPISIKYAGVEPCVPIRLTRIAAAEDMDVRVMFYAESRVVPTNYQHVEINPLLLDWRALAGNYEDVVTLAIDEAEGHAWVTEYAGPNFDVVSTDGLASELWDATAFTNLTPSQTLEELALQGFGGCTDEGLPEPACDWQHPLIGSVMEAFLPVPDGLTAAQFYSCLECYDALIDMDAWDPRALSEAIEERVMAPGRHALEIVQGYPYLSRLYTTLSPHEMIVDPFFHQNPDLFNYDLTMVTAEITEPCSGQDRATVPSATTPPFDFSADSLAIWPQFEGMPAVLRIEAMTTAGAPMVVQDNETAIREALADWQSSNAPEVEPRCHDGYPGDDGTAGHAEDDEGSGCACTTNGGRAGGLGFLLIVAGWVLRRQE